MKQPGLLPADYFSPDIYRREQAALFRRTWQLVGLRSQLAEHGQWFCVEVGGRSVVLQNFSGELRAFHNVCAHRQSRLRQVGTCGIGALRCPYHGWTYDEAGVAVGIPARREFELALAGQQAPALKSWRLEMIGQFLFINESTEAPGLIQSLGGLSNQVALMAEAADSVVSEDTLSIEANWKVVVENSIENYHVQQVHGATLDKHALTETEISFDGPHSRSRFTAKTSAHTLHAIDLAFPGRALMSREYEHLLLFPNTLFTHVYGAFFMISRVEPVSPQRCLSRTTIMTTRSDEASPEARSLRTLLVESNVAFIWRSYREDAPICEAVQLGLMEATGPAIFGAREVRIRQFQGTYRSMLHE